MKNEIPKKQESFIEALKRLEHVTITPEESALMFDTHLGLIIRGARPVNLPFMFILGGQAGAGKTYMEYASVEQSDKNLVVINLDNFKELHPAYLVLKKEDPAVIHKILGDDVRIWTKKAIKYCLDKKLNFSVESTMRGGSADPVINLIKEAKNKGFSVELKMMSVSPELSSLGIKERKEEQIIKSPERYGRDVSLASHEAMVKNIPATLRSIEDIKCFDNITIYSRKINVYDERLYEPFLSAITIGLTVLRSK